MNAKEFANGIVCAIENMNQRVDIDGTKIHVLSPGREVHISNVPILANALNVSVHREDWDGNSSCDTNHDIEWFMYGGVKFFALVDKEKEA